MKEKLELRAKAAKAIQDLAGLVNAEERDFAGEEQAEWDRANADYDQLSRQIARLQRASEIEAAMQAPLGDRRPGSDFVERDGRDDDERQPPTGADHALAVQAWCRAQEGLDLTERHQDAAELCGINPRARKLDLRLGGDYRSVRALYLGQANIRAALERRALSVVSGAAGGYLVPEGFVPQIEVSLLQFGGVRQIATIQRTDTGADLPWPTVDDTANKGELLGENTAAAEQDVAFGQIIFRAYKYSSKLIKVPVELLEDSAFDLVTFLGERMGERIGRIQNDHFTTGTGASQPKGIVEASGLGVTAASATAIAADELFDLVHSVDPAYRNMPGTAWMMHDSILKAVRKLKSTTNEYLWGPPGMDGRPADSLLGYPVVVNQSMAGTIATGNKTLLFGDLGKYMVRDVATIRLRRLVERYADADQEGFVAFLRSDGNLLDAGTDPVKHLKQA